MKILLGGKFNRLHPGHIHLFEQAKKLGDELIVVIAHDSNNKKDCAEPAIDRKNMLDKISIIDKVIIGSEQKFADILRKQNPDIIVLGYDQSLPPNTEEIILRAKIKVVKMGKYKNYCSSDSS
ncbi:adenylyltransferase/cytidyltransferase family protein [Candidatus Aenigmatarchaeota archaeon]